MKRGKWASGPDYSRKAQKSALFLENILKEDYKRPR
jgi:hypothetical protein